MLHYSVCGLLLFATGVSGLRSRDHALSTDPTFTCLGNGRTSKDATCSRDEVSFYSTSTSCPPTAITNCHGGHNGFGNLLSIFIGHYTWAQLNNRSFCVTPWSSMAHAQNASDMFGFIGGYSFGPRARYGTPNAWTQRSNIQFCTGKIIENVRRFYFSTPKPHLSTDERFVWHLRRGDTKPLPDSIIVSGMRTLKAMYPWRLQRLHFVSEGKPEDFAKIISSCWLLGIVCKVHLGEPLQTDFHRMVMADVLVQATHSTLSSAAGALNSRGVYLDKDLADGKTEPLVMESKAATWQAAFEQALCKEVK